MDYKLFEDDDENEVNWNNDNNNMLSTLTPVMRARSGNKNTDFTLIQRNCGDDDICVPDLVLDTHM